MGARHREPGQLRTGMGQLRKMVREDSVSSVRTGVVRLYMRDRRGIRR